MKKKYCVRDYILMGLMISFGLVLQIIDNFFNVTGIPGGKLGLPNIVSLANIFIFGNVNALIISAIRAFFGAMLFTGVSSLPYAVLGALCSTISMIIIKNKLYPKVSEVGISITGAVAHNYAQLIVAAIIFNNIKIFSYASVLTFIAIFAGFFTGVSVKFLNKKIFNKEGF